MVASDPTSPKSLSSSPRSLTASIVQCLAAKSPPIVVEIESPLASSHPLQGYLRQPSSAGPSPAVVLLHSCHGDWRRLDERWGKQIASWGYVTLTVDSFGPRGTQDLRRQSSERSEPGRLSGPEVSGARSIRRSRSCCGARFCERRPGGPDVGRTWLSGTGIANQVSRRRCILSTLPWPQGRA